MSSQINECRRCDKTLEQLTCIAMHKHIETSECSISSAVYTVLDATVQNVESEHVSYARPSTEKCCSVSSHSTFRSYATKSAGHLFAVTMRLGATDNLLDQIRHESKNKWCVVYAYFNKWLRNGR